MSSFNEQDLKWYQRKGIITFIIFVNIFVFIFPPDDFDRTNIWIGLLMISYCLISRKKAIKKFQTKPTTSKMIPDRIRQFNDASNYQKANFQEALKYSKIRKLLPNFVVLDFETTGLSPERDKIIQIAAIKFHDFKKIDEFCSYVNPQIKIPPHITKINGITDNDVKNAPNISEILPKLIEFIGDEIIVAHNAPFDLKFLLTNMYSNGIEYRRFRVVDTLSLARKYINSTTNHKLETMKSFLNLNHLKSHDALHDCYVTAELYKYCYKESMAMVSS